MDRDISFQAAMAYAIRHGAKRQTRRLLKPAGRPDRWARAIPGERLRVLEPYTKTRAGEIIYAADPHGQHLLQHVHRGWNSPRFLPRRLVRTVLVIEDIRTEPLQDITTANALAEGIVEIACGEFGLERTNTPSDSTATAAYARLWDIINHATAPWASNPWVVVLTFSVEPAPQEPA